jgi:dihydroorotate dehydrogenase electron transfer subunit
LKISTDDGSKGFKGTVVEHVVKTINIKDSPRIFACGPKMMLKVLRKFMLKKELQGEFSLENRMGCGMGVCQGCAIPVRNGYKLVCKDGPVFDFAEIGDEYWQNV